MNIKESNYYNQSIDFVKGILILLVFLGHLVVGKIEDNLVRYFIYSFHMPLFIGISGYLFNFNSLNNNPKVFIKKLFGRILIPYILANFFYSTFINIDFLIKFNFKEFVIGFFKSIIFSYYHLWYIQGYISYIIVSYLLLKFLKFDIKNLIIGLIISLFIYYLYFFIKPENIFIKIFLNNFRSYNLIFFIIGYFIKEKKINIKISKNIVIIGTLIFFINSILEFFTIKVSDIYIYIYQIQNIIIYYISNILLIIILLKICEEYLKMQNKIINFIGKNSLYFYLWHVLPIMILKSKILDKNIYLYYLLGIISFWLLYLIIKKYILMKNKKVEGKNYV
ncbi:acyltransferase [uncultured Fusobacterium sp.]|uniref:acyltransferase n=1 Tax=uncultured Fusobacterium sp. TaxID=159267 RepID=UPI00345304A3